MGAQGVSKIQCSCVSVVIFSKMATTTYAASPAVTYAARAPVTCAVPAVTYAASARDVCSTRGELHGACSQLHCTSTSGDVRCAAPCHVRGCCTRGDVRRASGQLRGSITDHRD